jgi:phage terminase large subunit GpA-like protein
MQTLEWENMLAHLDEEHPEKAHFTCEGCGAEIHEHHRPKMLRGARWVARNPKMKRYHRSFHIWSAYSLLQRFEQVARDWLSARGDPPKEQTFMNDVVGRAYRVLGEAPPWEEIRDLAMQSDYARGTVPAGYPLLTCGVDCQGDRVEWQVVAWGPNKRRAVIEYGVFQGHISEEKCQAHLNGLLRQGFRNSYGRKIEIDLLAIDGNAYTEDVWDWTKRHPASRVIMVRGGNRDAAPLFQRVKAERNRRGELVRYSRRFFNFNGAVLKMALYRNLKKTDPEVAGHVLFPRGLEDEYFKQLTAETRKEETNKRTGFKRWLWVKDPQQANEGLDTALQAEAAFIRMAGVQRTLPDSEWDRLLAERECPPEDVQADFEDLLMSARPTEHVPQPAGQDGTDPEERAKKQARAKWGNRT